MSERDDSSSNSSSNNKNGNWLCPLHSSCFAGRFDLDAIRLALTLNVTWSHVRYDSHIHIHFTTMLKLFSLSLSLFLSCTFPPSLHHFIFIFGWFDKCCELSSVVGKGSITTGKNANQIENEDGENGILSLYLSLSLSFFIVAIVDRENCLTAIEMISLIEMIESQKRKETIPFSHSLNQCGRFWTDDYF